MNDYNAAIPKPKKIGVWAEGTHIEAKEYIIPKIGTDSSDDIPTIPDIDDFQDVLEKEIAKPPISSHADSETVNTLAEVGGDVSAIEGVDAALEMLKSHIPHIELDSADTVWTIDSLLTHLLES